MVDVLACALARLWMSLLRDEPAVEAVQRIERLMCMILQTRVLAVAAGRRLRNSAVDKVA